MHGKSQSKDKVKGWGQKAYQLSEHKSRAIVECLDKGWSATIFVTTSPTFWDWGHILLAFRKLLFLFGGSQCL